MTDPRTSESMESMACAFTKGAAATTPGCFCAPSTTALHPARRLSGPVICTCDATPRMRARSSFWNPFITDSTTISAATPSAMPAMDISDMKEMK